MPSRSGPLLRVAVDTGGTFTDCIWIERGEVQMVKVFSTPDDPSRAIVEAMQRIGHHGPVLLLHGTTVGTNTLLERKGARVAFVTTAGFEDSIEIGRQARPKLYDFFFDRVPPLASSDMRFGVEERTSPTGEVLRAVEKPALQSLAQSVAAKKPEAIAVSLLFSFANPENERAVAAVLEELGVPLSISSEILPEFREYERASTVLLNAYLQPVMQRYLERLESAVSAHAGKQSRVFVMQSSGGIAALSAARREPVRTVLSGPAGGVVGASMMGRRSGFERIIGFDMGGTSTDVVLVDGVPHAGSEGEVAGLPVRVPMLDIHTVGAGGGSLARFDAAGALRVGPESAGADPGPICYGRGEQPTVTDANLLLGRLQPTRFLGGDFKLDLQRTRTIVARWLKANKSEMTVEAFAAGVVRVVNATMEKAVRVVSIERGYDPRDFALVAFGGAGGLHACELSAGLGIRRVIVPAMPGALSAFGILVSDVVKDYSRTVVWRTREVGWEKRARAAFAELRRKAEQDFRQEHWTGKIQWDETLDLRYRGQGYELNVPFSRDSTAVFHAEHKRRYGYSHEKREIEIVTLRLRARLVAPDVKWTLPPPHPSGEQGRTKVWNAGKRVAAAVVERDSLRYGRKQFGPAVVTEYSATAWVPPRAAYALDRAGNLVIEL
ncbi:MAG: hydantoinase/oxoprolinase family protein [Terriglobales bacterium]